MLRSLVLLAVLLSPASGAPRQAAVPPLPRSAVVAGFEKQGLPVPMTLSARQTEALAARHGEDPRVAKAVELYQATRAERSVAISGGALRGRATRAVITIAEDADDGIVVRGYAKGDPRTEAGRANVRANTRRLLAKFRDMVLARSERLAFAEPPEPAGAPAIDEALRARVEADLAPMIRKFGFRRYTVEPGIPDHAMGYMRVPHVLVLMSHPRDLMDLVIVQQAGGMPVVYDYESEEGVITIGVTLKPVR
jgi:hypothetical protein